MSLRIYLVALILFSTILATIGRPEEGDDEDGDDDEPPPKPCYKYLFDIIMKILKSLLKCLGGQSYFKMNNIFELVTRAPCLLKCTMQEEGIFGEDGTLDDLGAAFYFEEHFPHETKDTIIPATQECFELGKQMNPKEYWCKSYLPFMECGFKAILKGLIPYGGDCIATPTIGLLFSVLRFITPDSPAVAQSLEDLKRSVYATPRYRCFGTNCTQLYEYKKVNGSQSIVVYNKDMEVISIEKKKPGKKPSQPQGQPTPQYQNTLPSQNQYQFKYQYNPSKYSYGYSASGTNG